MTKSSMSLFLFYCRDSWADLSCEEMEERERAGETSWDTGPSCPQEEPKQQTCTIEPLRMNCYKLWLEVPSQLGLIKSKPIYLEPIEHGEQ